MVITNYVVNDRKRSVIYVKDKINPLQLSFPNFVLGQIIDPDEANQNNSDIANKVNEFITEVEGAILLAQDADTKADDAILISSDADTKSDNAILIASTKGDEAISIATVKGDDAIDKANDAIDIANTKGDSAIDIGTNAELVANTKGDSAINIATTKGDDAILTATTLGNEAKTIAEGAKATAEGVQTDYTTLKPELTQAVVDATNALTIANGADDKADIAISDSANAIIIADEADTKADVAIITSNNADGKADSAVVTASEAKTIAEGADNNATNALTTATHVEADYNTLKPTLEQAVIDVNDAVATIETKASVEYVNNKSVETINYVINEIDRREPVDTEADLYITYPDAEDGWICLVRSTRNQYVFNGATNTWDIRPDEIGYADEVGNDGIITSEKFIEINQVVGTSHAKNSKICNRNINRRLVCKGL